MLGNRGVLHDASGTIVRPWRVKAWIACRLAFKGRHRAVMTPDRWTELFFLDEATALAAGHRPCFECRREDAKRFKAAWLTGQQRQDDPPIATVDQVLHAERIDSNGQKVKWRERLALLPEGTMVAVDDGAALWWRGRLLCWSFDGYGPISMGMPEDVWVLTPRSIVAAMKAGYRPVVHESANA